MGYTTDFIGYVEVEPTLNHDEQQYLSAFQQSRRYERAGGSYEVPSNPFAENTQGECPADVDRFNRVGRPQPSLWCGWTPALDGAYLTFDGHEKFYCATEWMSYLIDHFLAPGAMASTTHLPWFEGFTFDHTVNGVIAASRRDTGDLYLIRVSSNVVTEERLWPPVGAIGSGMRSALPYEVEIDRWDRDV